jgi:cytoskeleton protein RodZ
MSQSVGDQLKQARQDRKITLAQAADATRVKLRYLEALENNDLATLPSKVQGKGFLRIYGEYLGLPIQPRLDAWEGKTPAAPVQPVLPPITPDQSSADSEPISQPLPPPSPTAPPLSPSLDIYKSIGFQLTERREALGLSLSEVEHHIKVRAANLQALEEGRIVDLPSTVQARGMLSNYAAFLGLNVDAVLLTFAEGLQLNRTERLSAPTKTGRKSGRRPATPQKGIQRFLTPDLLIGSGVILMLFFFAIWTASRINSERTAQLEETTPSTLVDSLLTPGTPTLAITVQFTQVVLPEDLTGAGEPGASVEPSITPTLPVLGSGPVQIYVIAHQRAWIRITADGKEIFSGRLTPGNVYAYAAKEKIELLTGNAAGVQVIYNQNDLGILGLNGQVYSMIFSLEGAVTPTPRFTPTPSPMPTATRTPQPSPTQPTPTVTQFIP